MKKLLIILTMTSLLFACDSEEGYGPLPRGEAPPTNIQIAGQVKEEFLHCWHGYKNHAWGHDELKPLSKSYHDWYSEPLLITAVDALDSLIIMGFKQEAEETLAFIKETLSFDKDISVKTFEITIRVLGGLLSSYQLTGDEKLLDLAEDLGNRMLPVFNSPTGMPYRMVNLKTGKTDGSVTNPAEIGTLMLEFGTLGKLTNRPAFFDRAKAAVTKLFESRSEIGLVGQRINVETGEWVVTDSHIGGEIDSYYEYLYKSWLLFEDEDFKTMWDASISAINEYLADENEHGFWYGRADMNTGERTATVFGSLEAFFPAVLVLSGDKLRAVNLLDSCYMVWREYGIEPESIDYSELGILDPAYHLRPEIIESAYYLYQATINDFYRRMGRTFLESLKNYCRADTGYAEIADVRSGEQNDIMESFFLSETLKYLYLLFCDDSTLGADLTVFTTEAHPLKKTW